MVFYPRLSLYFLTSLIGIYVGAVCCVFLTTLVWPVKLILFSWLLVSFYKIAKEKVFLWHKKSVVSFQFDGKYWHLSFPSGETYLATLKNNRFISRCVLILNFSTQGNISRSVILFQDGLSMEKFRSLKSMLCILRNDAEL